MLKLFAFLIIILSSSYAFAERDACLKLKTSAETLQKKAVDLLGKYKEEMAVFGFSPLMILEKDPEDAGEHILRMAGLARGCSVLIEGKSCNFVSKEIISMLSNGLSLCSQDTKEKCGLCK